MVSERGDQRQVKDTDRHAGRRDQHDVERAGVTTLRPSCSTVAVSKPAAPAANAGQQRAAPRAVAVRGVEHAERRA